MSNLIYPAIKGLTLPVLKTPEWQTLRQTAPGGQVVTIQQLKNPIWHFTLTYDYLYDSFRSPNNTQLRPPYTDLQTMLGMFLASAGTAENFLFDDPTDNCAGGLRSGIWQSSTTMALGRIVIANNGHAQQVTIAGTTGATFPAFSASGGTATDGGVTWQDLGFFPAGYPNFPSPLPLVTDGAGNYYSPLQRNVGGLFLEDVTDLYPAGGRDSSTLTVWANGALTSNYTLLGPGLALPGSSYSGLYLKWNALPTAPITAVFRFYFRVAFETDTQDFENSMAGLWTIGGSTGKNGAGYVKLRSDFPSTI